MKRNKKKFCSIRNCVITSTVMWHVTPLADYINVVCECHSNVHGPLIHVCSYNSLSNFLRLFIRNRLTSLSGHTVIVLD